MNKVLVLIITMLSQFAVATMENSNSFQLKHILSGNLEIGGGFSALQVSNKGDSHTQYSIYPQLEYFIFDHFSVGGSLSYFNNSHSEETVSGFGLGPSATYYFMELGNSAFYVNQNISFFKFADSPYEKSASTSLGSKFFIVPQVAFGIALKHSYNLSESSQIDGSTSTSLQGNFSFYY
jgi:hypothetical protein